MHKCHVVSLVVVSLAVVALAACQDRVITLAPPAATAPEQRPVMSVTGSATIEIIPDCADLTMTLSADAPRPGQATALVNQHKADLVASLARHGVTGADLKLSFVSLEPVYDPRDPAHRLTGYHAAITITATTHDFAAIDALLDVASDAGATEISSRFRRSDLPEFKKRVRDMALAAARNKARQIATALDLELGRVVGVSEGGGGSLWSSSYVSQVSNAIERVPARSRPRPRRSRGPRPRSRSTSP